jgi:hypothetical protein
MLADHAFPEVQNHDTFRTLAMREAATALHMENPEDDRYKVMKDRVDEDESFRAIIGEWVSKPQFNATTLMILSLQGCGPHPACSHFHAFGRHHINCILLLWR